MKKHLLTFLLLTSTCLLSVTAFAQEVPGYWSNGVDSLLGPDPSMKSGIKLTNYPNPVTTNTTIEYVMPDDGQVSLNVYNSAGQLVTILVNGFIKAGSYSISYNSFKLSRGTYICRLSVVSGLTVSHLIRKIYVVNN